MSTIEFRISVGTTLIYFEYFSHFYALIWEPTLISFELFRYRVEKQNLQVVKPLCFEHLNENMAQNSSPTCKHILFALINSKKLIVKCLGM